jgi:hypothetical protein
LEAIAVSAMMRLALPLLSWLSKSSVLIATGSPRHVPAHQMSQSMSNVDQMSQGADGWHVSESLLIPTSSTIVVVMISDRLPAHQLEGYDDGTPGWQIVPQVLV